jgi:transcriptional regulator with XRE-family HTH domain
MERKYPSYIKEWRKYRGLTQQQVLDRLAILAGDPKPNDEALQIPTTGASLSRIENGKQNFNMAALAALAKVLDVEEPGWLLDRNPLKEGKVVSFFEKLDEKEAAQAVAVLEAMFGRAAG